MSAPGESKDASRLLVSRCVFQDCRRKFTYDPNDLQASSYPFCSPRCKGADLGNWVNEAYKVEGPPDLRDLEDEDEPQGRREDDEEE